MMITPLTVLCYRNIIERNLQLQIDCRRKTFVVFDEPEIIEIFIWVMDNKIKVSYLKMSDKQVIVFAK